MVRTREEKGNRRERERKWEIGKKVEREREGGKMEYNGTEKLFNLCFMMQNTEAFNHSRVITIGNRRDGFSSLSR